MKAQCCWLHVTRNTFNYLLPSRAALDCLPQVICPVASECECTRGEGRRRESKEQSNNKNLHRDGDNRASFISLPPQNITWHNLHKPRKQRHKKFNQVISLDLEKRTFKLRAKRWYMFDICQYVKTFICLIFWLFLLRSYLTGMADVTF